MQMGGGEGPPINRWWRLVGVLLQAAPAAWATAAATAASATALTVKLHASVREGYPTRAQRTIEAARVTSPLSPLKGHSAPIYYNITYKELYFSRYQFCQLF